MSTSFLNSEPSIPRQSQVDVAYGQLRAFFQKERERGTTKKLFSASRLYDIAGNVGSVNLAGAIAHLLKDGVVKQVIRVEPHLGEGIGDFDSIEEVPDTLSDWRHSGDQITILPQHLQLYYKLPENDED